MEQLIFILTVLTLLLILVFVIMWLEVLKKYGK